MKRLFFLPVTLLLISLACEPQVTAPAAPDAPPEVANERILRPQSATSAWMAFIHAKKNPSAAYLDPSAVYLMDVFDPTSMRPLIDDPSYYDQFPDWSPQGDQIVFQRAPVAYDPVTGQPNADWHKSEIYIQDLKADMTLDGPPVALTSNSYPDLYPAWSPDGLKIAWQCKKELVSCGGGTTAVDDICYVERPSLTGPWGTAKNLTFSTACEWDREPAWSPKSDELIYWKSTFGWGSVELYTVDLATGTETQRTFSPDIQEMDPDWSPSNKIVFTTTDDDRNIYTVALNDLGTMVSLKTLTSASTFDWQPDWALGGQQIIFSRGTPDGGFPDLWMMDFNGGKQIALVKDPDAHSSHGRIKP